MNCSKSSEMKKAYSISKEYFGFGRHVCYNRHVSPDLQTSIKWSHRGTQCSCLCHPKDEDRRHPLEAYTSHRQASRQTDFLTFATLCQECHQEMKTKWFNESVEPFCKNLGYCTCKMGQITLHKCINK